MPSLETIHEKFLQCSGLCIDTRKIQPGTFFVAIKGDRFDANTFAAEALEKGATFVLIDNADYFIDARTILVENTLETLQELARFHRNYLKLPIIALTGSNGKTTTKELIQAVLSKKFTTRATLGNLNNHIGVPLTLLSFDQDTEIGIVEMGANHQREIAGLCEIAQPDFGYITNFGKAHLEGFGGIEGVIKGKSEMYDYLVQHGKTAFVNLEDALQVEKTKALKTITFGIQKPEADTNIERIGADPFVAISFNGLLVQSHLIGLYNANNINAAIAMGRHFGVNDEQAKAAIEGYIPENNRSQLIEKHGHSIILDAYNANPSSMKVALENFIQMDKPNKMAFLGDMFELGKESPAEHQGIVRQLMPEKDIAFHLVGKDFYAFKNNVAHLHFYEDFDALSKAISTQKITNAAILIKGSRGMELERLLDLL